MRVSSIRSTGVLSSFSKAQATISPTNNVCPPVSIAWRSSQSSQATHCDRIGAPVTP